MRFSQICRKLIDKVEHETAVSRKHRQLMRPVRQYGIWKLNAYRDDIAISIRIWDMARQYTCNSIWKTQGAVRSEHRKSHTSPILHFWTERMYSAIFVNDFILSRSQRYWCVCVSVLLFCFWLCSMRCGAMWRTTRSPAHIKPQKETMWKRFRSNCYLLAVL